MWNRFINEHLRGNEYLMPFDPPGRAIRYAPIVAFFAPIGALKRFLLPKDASPEAYPSESWINVALRGVLSSSDRRRACELELDIDGMWVADSSNVAGQIAETIIEPAGQGDEEALKIWNAVVDSLIDNLNAAAIPLDSSNHDAILFRGMNIDYTLYSGPGSYADPKKFHEFTKRLLDDMSNVFVSATKSEPVAVYFTEVDRTKIDDRWLFEMAITDGTLVIDVNKVLPETWRCFAHEDEVILAPGNIYTSTNVMEFDFQGRSVLNFPMERDQGWKVYITVDPPPRGDTDQSRN
tara:strand:- start:1527 stop:2408 length:882 start_codon:yes stop_codon:yes gene_type:complete